MISFRWLASLTLMLFVVALIAGVAVLKTCVAPRWAGVAFLLFPPVFACYGVRLGAQKLLPIEVDPACEQSQRNEL